MKNWKNRRVWFVLLAVLVVVLYIGSTGRRDTAETGTAVVTETLTQDESEEIKTEGLSEEPGQEEQADFVGSEEPQAAAEVSEGLMRDDTALDPDGTYTSCEDVALYLKTYGELPGNFITKKEAQALGWEGGSLEPYAPGKCIGGDKFGNYEGNLPKEKGRVYHECDIDTLGEKSRGAKRIVYSNDGLIYYTEDHYESFTLLYE